MADYYASALFTISAVAADSIDYGIFEERDPRKTSACPSLDSLSALSGSWW